MNSVAFLVLCCISYYKIPSVYGNLPDNYTITIVHANDLFSAFAGVQSDNSLCDLNTRPDQCIGGAPKIVSKINEWRSREPIIFVNGGNNLGGFWYKEFGPQVLSDFFRHLQFDVINLGLSDYELYDNDSQTSETFANVTQFITYVSHFSRIISCNVAVETKYISNFYSNVRPAATILGSEQTKIGYIGFVKNPNNPTVVSTAKRQSNSKPGFEFVDIRDPIKCLQDESDIMRKNGVDIVVAIGTGDEDLFKEIALNVPNVDIVIGSYAYTKNVSLLRERTATTYPDLVVNGSTGATVIATADVFGKSIGRLSVTFDRKGNIKSSEGTLIKLDNKIASDKQTDQLVESYQRGLYVGTTKVFLDASECSTRECNIGNLMADSLLFYRINYINESFIRTTIKTKGNEILKARIDEKRDVIALISSESISNSIGNVKSDEYFITKIGLYYSLNRRDPKIQMFILDGKTIRQLLSAHVWRTDLLQVSGIKVIYDLLKPINDTIIDVSVKCSLCPNNTYNALDDNKLYDVLLPQSIALDQNNQSLQVVQEMNLMPLIEQYIKENSPIKTTIENRITIIGKKATNTAFGAKSEASMTLFCVLIAVCQMWL